MALPASSSASRKTNSTKTSCMRRWRIRSNLARLSSPVRESRLLLRAVHRQPDFRRRWQNRIPQLSDEKVSKSNFRPNSGNSVDISKAFFEMGIWKFESSVVSQAVTQLQIVGERIR